MEHSPAGVTQGRGRAAGSQGTQGKGNLSPGLLRGVTAFSQKKTIVTKKCLKEGQIEILWAQQEERFAGFQIGTAKEDMERK